jgi:hypothetical protein
MHDRPLTLVRALLSALVLCAALPLTGCGRHHDAQPQQDAPLFAPAIGGATIPSAAG